MKCKCCHASFDEFVTESVCPICGFENIETLGEDEERVLIIADKYRDTILERIKAISIQAHKYVWNGKNGSFDAIETIELFDPKLSGKDYYCNTVYSKQKIHQVGIGMEQTIEINYSFAGSPKTAIVKLTPVQSSEPWSMSLEIDKNLRLNVMLGALCDNEDEVPPPPDRHVWAVVDLDLHA